MTKKKATILLFTLILIALLIFIGVFYFVGGLWLLKIVGTILLIIIGTSTVAIIIFAIKDLFNYIVNNQLDGDILSFNKDCQDD